MPARIITVTSGKGGVGKTTTTANVGVALALLGKRVACLDADIGLRNLDVVLGLENRIVYDMVDVVEGRCRLRQALIKDKRLSDLYLLPASQKRDKSAVKPSDLIKLCNDLRPEFDYVLIDSAAGIEEGDEVIVPPYPGITSAMGLLTTDLKYDTIRTQFQVSGNVDLDRLMVLSGAHVVRLARENELAWLYPDCEPGAMPPLGPLYHQRVFVDSSLTAEDEIVFNAGTHRDAIRMKFADFKRLAQPQVGEFAAKG